MSKASLRAVATACALLCSSFSAHATIQLLAIGSLSGQHDLSTQTAGLLENGLAGNILGGLGSGLAYAGNNTFISTPDRGPNATPFNSRVDDTTSYISRFHTLKMNLVANTNGNLPFKLTPTLQSTTLLSSATPLTYGSGTGLNIGSGVPVLNAINQRQYFSGRSDNFDPNQTSLNPNNGRFDPEGVRVSNDGRSIFVADEYGPYVYQFDRASGERIRSFALPGNLAVNRLSAQGDVEIANNRSGRVANKGMEGLAITPDGKTLVGIMQAPLAQDSNKNVRIVTIDIASGETHQYAYKLSSGSGVSEIVALNAHQFLVDERDGKGLGDGSSAQAKQIFQIDLRGAKDVSALQGDLSAHAVKKTLFLDLVKSLNANGIASSQIPAKIESLSFGQDVMVNGVLTHTLYIANDNDFVPGVAGDNKFYVYGVNDADLAQFGVTYTPQALVPEAETWGMLLAGLGMLTWLKRRRN